MDTPYKFTGSVGTAACIIIIPLADTLRIVILRISKRQSPFNPDKSHIHHAIMRLGMSHGQTTMILAGVQVIFIGLAIAFSQFTDAYLLSGLLVLSFLLSITLDRLIINRLSD
jgi:UDP-N-acetylmuramyl pentapeptide phosphotransferase/UDP-N-acetylglucosamine-1-phosphate transferase